MSNGTAGTRHKKRLETCAPDLINQTLFLKRCVTETVQEFFDQLEQNPQQMLGASKGGSGYDLTFNTIFALKVEIPYRLTDDGPVTVRLISTRRVDGNESDASDATVFTYQKQFPPE